jgi:hypothetical protein
MFVLGSKIEIGKFRFKGVNGLVITKSILEMKNTAIIKIPTTSVLTQNGKRITSSVQTAHQFKVGEKVSIELAYNNRYNNEFVGFVSRINLTTPVEIECEGYSYQLRKKKNIVKSWKTTTLLEVLKEVVSGTDVKLHPKIPDIPLKNLVINKASGTQVIEYLKELLKGTLTACFFDDVLYVGLTYADVTNKTVKYKLGWNTVSETELKYREAKDEEVNIEFQIREPDGKQKTISSGKTGGVTRRETLTAVTDSKHMEDIAKAKLLQESYDGYEGSLLAFLEPYAQPGYRAELTATRYKEREGNYFVVGTVVEFGMSGARRKPEIGIKLS